MRQKQLGQQAGTTSAVTIYSPGSGIAASQLMLTVTNVTGSADSYSIWQDHDGSTYNDASCTHKAVVIAANTTKRIPIGPMNNSSGNTAVACGVNAAVTFTLHGVEELVSA